MRAVLGILSLKVWSTDIACEVHAYKLRAQFFLIRPEQSVNKWFIRWPKHEEYSSYPLIRNTIFYFRPEIVSYIMRLFKKQGLCFLQLGLCVWFAF